MCLICIIGRDRLKEKFQRKTRTCIINDSWKQDEHQKQRKYTFLVESRQATFNTNVLKVYINFQRQKKTFKKITTLTGNIPV